jgi:hypothetical protein
MTGTLSLSGFNPYRTFTEAVSAYWDRRPTATADLAAPLEG